MRLKLLIFLLLLALLIGPAHAYWEHSVVSCDERNANCQVLQMVMMGSFDCFDPDDSINGRVLSAAFHSLRLITEADFEHFMEEFSIDPAVLQHDYYISLANCLWADILNGADPGGQASAVRRILLLFLDPASQEDAQAQMDIIRAQTDEAFIAEMAASLRLSADFVEFLIFTDNWHAELMGFAS